MWLAQIAPGYVSTYAAFATEDEAVAWVEREMRAAGTTHGIYWEVGDGE